MNKLLLILLFITLSNCIGTNYIQLEELKELDLPLDYLKLVYENKELNYYDSLTTFSKSIPDYGEPFSLEHKKYVFTDLEKIILRGERNFVNNLSYPVWNTEFGAIFYLKDTFLNSNVQDTLLSGSYDYIYSNGIKKIVAVKLQQPEFYTSTIKEIDLKSKVVTEYIIDKEIIDIYSEQDSLFYALSYECEIYTSKTITLEFLLKLPSRSCSKFRRIDENWILYIESQSTKWSHIQNLIAYSSLTKRKHILFHKEYWHSNTFDFFFDTK